MGFFFFGFAHSGLLQTICSHFLLRDVKAPSRILGGNRKKGDANVSWHIYQVKCCSLCLCLCPLSVQAVCVCVFLWVWEFVCHSKTRTSTTTETPQFYSHRLISSSSLTENGAFGAKVPNLKGATLLYFCISSFRCCCCLLLLCLLFISFTCKNTPTC